MTLIKSISGIRGTIGNTAGENLTPLDIVRFSAAFAAFIRESLQNVDKDSLFERIDDSGDESQGKALKMVVGRDARTSGAMVNRIVCGTLQSMGVDVVDLGLSTTPTVEMAVVKHNANGGIIITASHNPMQWNALKLLNADGEFVSAADAQKIVSMSESDDFEFSGYDKIGGYEVYDKAVEDHVNAILALPLVDVNAITKANFRVIVDAVNSIGALAVPYLLKRLGVHDHKILNSEMNGIFTHNPEPIPENLSGICNEMARTKFDVGFVVDPDVDRLAIVSENGELIGEEYTLVAVADYVLSNTPGNTVSNLSSTRALRDVSERHGVKYTPSAVGEVNVVEAMKATSAVIGGEGNGGVIYPELHSGRDALVGIALFLSFMAKSKKSCSQIRALYPNYSIVKKKTELDNSVDIKNLLHKIAQKYDNYSVNTVDGVKIDFEDSWVHVRPSNTEPIIRIYAEALSEQIADNIASKLMLDIREMTKQNPTI